MEAMARGGATATIFIHGTDKVGRGLMVLYFGLAFSVAFLPLEIFLPAPVMEV